MIRSYRCAANDAQACAMRMPPPLLLLLCACCAGGPTQQRPRPIGQPFTSAGRIYDLYLSPQAAARDLDDLGARSRQLLARETDLSGIADGSKRLLAAPVDEAGRLDEAAQFTRGLLAAETDRLADLADASALAPLDPTKDLADLRAALEQLPSTLQLDRRPMAEPDDLERRTDPDDDRPEASWWNRLLRRIFP